MIAIPLGLILTVAWVGIDAITPHFAILGHRSALNPLTRFAHTPWLVPFLAVRFAGLVVIAPVAEELFWRGFLLRWIIRPEAFRDIPLGTFDPLSFGAVVALMAITHPEWLAAAVFSASMNLLLYRTRNLFACMATHATTNLALGVYVLLTHAWRFW
jgi:CAAX prenyl protease-like protein